MALPSRPYRTFITASSSFDQGLIVPPSRPHRTTISALSQTEEAIMPSAEGRRRDVISSFWSDHQALIVTRGARKALPASPQTGPKVMILDRYGVFLSLFAAPWRQFLKIRMSASASFWQQSVRTGHHNLTRPLRPAAPLGGPHEGVRAGVRTGGSRRGQSWRTRTSQTIHSLPSRSYR